MGAPTDGALAGEEGELVTQPTLIRCHIVRCNYQGRNKRHVYHAPHVAAQQQLHALQGRSAHAGTSGSGGAAATDAPACTCHSVCTSLSSDAGPSCSSAGSSPLRGPERDRLVVLQRQSAAAAAAAASSSHAANIERRATEPSLPTSTPRGSSGSAATCPVHGAGAAAAGARNRAAADPPPAFAGSYSGTVYYMHEGEAPDLPHPSNRKFVLAARHQGRCGSCSTIRY